MEVVPKAPPQSLQLSLVKLYTWCSISYSYVDITPFIILPKLNSMTKIVPKRVAPNVLQFYIMTSGLSQ